MANNFVYFMKDPHTGLIKIGQSKNPEKRMKSIRTNHPGVTILATMEDHSLERELHDRFSHCRREGEWFEPSHALMLYIKGHSGRPDLPETEIQQDDNWPVYWGIIAALLSVLCMIFTYLQTNRMLAGHVTIPDKPLLDYFVQVVMVLGTVLFYVVANMALKESHTPDHPAR